MANQTDYQKILENVIKPLQRLYDKEFDAATIDDYIVDLKHFSEPALKAAIISLRREYKRCPTLAHIIEACRDYRGGNAAAGDNSQICDCGKHKGVGNWTPEEKARTYKNLTTKLGMVDSEKERFWKSYEQIHGSIPI